MAITLDGTTGISSVDGSAASPSVRGADSNSGIVYAADTVSISTGGTERLEVDSSGNIDIPDNGKIRLGGSGDLSLYHDGTNSYIQDSGTGELRLRGTNIRFSDDDGSETFALFTDNGACELFYNNAKKFETNQYGCKSIQHLYFDDDHKLQLGSSQDLQIYHDGSNSFIDDAGTGHLIVRTSRLVVEGEPGGGENLLWAIKDAEVKLFHNNSGKFETTSTGTYTTGTHAQSGSDIRLKENIVNIENATEKVEQLQGFTYDFNSTGLELGLNSDRQVGLSAQDVKTVVPEAISTIPNSEYLTLNYEKLVPLLIESIKELSAEVKTLKTKVAALEAG